MILILIALIAVIVLSMIGIYRFQYTTFGGFFCPFIAVFGFCGLFTYAFLVYNYIAADFKKDIVNREYKTNYTQLEVFYASDVIDTIRDLDRKRIEVGLKDRE